jgi:hypothetical protein
MDDIAVASRLVLGAVAPLLHNEHVPATGGKLVRSGCADDPGTHDDHIMHRQALRSSQSKSSSSSWSHDHTMEASTE